MSVHYVSGSSVNNNGGKIIQGGSVSATLVDNVAASNEIKLDGNQSTLGTDRNTIQRASAGAVQDITNVGGFVAIELGSAPSEGDVISITGATYPFSSSYLVTSVSGNYGITSTEYNLCSGITASGTATLDSGSFDPQAQNQTLMMGYTTSIAGVANTALLTVKSETNDSVNRFNKYRSRVYATNWQAFTGSVDKCDITSTEISLTTDDALDDHTVLFSIGNSVKAADITNPDTTGLRAPSA